MPNFDSHDRYFAYHFNHTAIRPYCSLFRLAQTLPVLNEHCHAHLSLSDLLVRPSWLPLIPPSLYRTQRKCRLWAFYEGASTWLLHPKERRSRAPYSQYHCVGSGPHLGLASSPLHRSRRSRQLLPIWPRLPVHALTPLAQAASFLLKLPAMGAIISHHPFRDRLMLY